MNKRRVVPGPANGTRRRTQPLDRAEIVAAAISATDEGRLHELTMRGLAETLNVTPMALYAHVVDKDDILDEVLDHLLLEIVLPGDDLEWHEWMAQFAQQLNGMLIAHPDVLSRYLRRPVGVRTAIARMEAAVSVLHAAGFDDAESIDIYSSLHTCTIGFTALEVARRGLDSSTTATSGLAIQPDSAGFWPAFFMTLPGDEFPHLSRIRPDLRDFTAPERFHALIGDLLASHRPPARQRTRRVGKVATK